MKRLSIIIPFYNVEQYITQCLDSVYAQDIPEEEYKQEVIKGILTMPAEVIIDLHNEIVSLSHTTKPINDGMTAYGGFYAHEDDLHLNTGILGESRQQGVIIHELGHAMDHEENGYSSKNNNFITVFEKEMEIYLSYGNERYEYDSGSDSSIYCTCNYQEMYAECYALLMYGTAEGSAETILTYFPECLELVKEHIKYVRSLPQEDSLATM